MHHKGHKDEYFKTIFAEKHKNKPTQKGTIFQIAFSTSVSVIQLQQGARRNISHIPMDYKLSKERGTDKLSNKAFRPWSTPG